MDKEKVVPVAEPRDNFMEIREFTPEEYAHEIKIAEMLKEEERFTRLEKFL